MATRVSWERGSVHWGRVHHEGLPKNLSDDRMGVCVCREQGVCDDVLAVDCIANGGLISPDKDREVDRKLKQEDLQKGDVD